MNLQAFFVLHKNDWFNVFYNYNIKNILKNQWEVILILNLISIYTISASTLSSGMSQIGQTIYADSSGDFSNINPYLLFKIFEMADHMISILALIFIASFLLVYSMKRLANAQTKLTRYLIGAFVSFLGALVIGFFIIYPMMTKASEHIANARDPFNTTAAKVIVFEDEIKQIKHSIFLSPEVSYIKEPLK